MGNHPEMPKREATLLKRQKGKCTHCGLYFTESSVMEVDHVIPNPDFSQAVKNQFT